MLAWKMWKIAFQCSGWKNQFFVCLENDKCPYIKMNVIDVAMRYSFNPLKTDASFPSFIFFVFLKIYVYVFFSAR